MKLKRRVGIVVDPDTRFDAPLDESSERSQKRARFADAVEEEDEEASGSTAATSQTVSQHNAPAVAQKRGRRTDSESETERDETEIASPKKKARAPPPPNPKKADRIPTKEKAGSKTKAPVKTARRGGATAEIDAALDAEFNKLKLVRPVYAPVVKTSGTRMDWDDEEQVRKKFEDDGPTQWGAEPTQQGKFVVKYFEVKPRENLGPRTDLAVEAKWANRPNYKKFQVRPHHLFLRSVLTVGHDSQKLEDVSLSLVSLVLLRKSLPKRWN